MKRSLLALAALTAFAGVASAQSSVTLFGIVDVNVRNQKNGDAGSQSTLSTDGNASSRLGFRGVEDLGGGLRAGFWLEGALAPDTGNATGQTWQRRSTVSLLGGFGEIRLGRDYTPTFWNHTVFDPFGTNGVGSQTNLMTQAAADGTTSGSRALNVPGSGTGTLVRANNTIGYFLPANLGGLYGQVMYAFGEKKSGALVGGQYVDTGNQYAGARLGYGAGPVNVALAYGKTAVSGNDLKAWNLGGSFNAGFATVMAQYHKYKRDPADQTNWMIGALVPAGPGTLKASYGKAKLDSGTASFDANQWAFGYVYDMSKRTALYAHYSRVDNDDGLRFVTSASGPNNTGTGFKSTGYEFGVRHSF